MAPGSGLTRRDATPIRLETLGDVMQAAEIMAGTELVPRPLRSKPAATALVMLKGQAMGLDPFESLTAIDIIDDKPVPNAQTRLGQIRRHGHEATWASNPNDRERAAIRWRRREDAGDPDAFTVSDYTVETAAEAGLLDEWVERKYKLQGDRYDRTEKFLLRIEGGHYVGKQLDSDLPGWAVEAIKAGKVKRKDNWFLQRPAMLRARCASTLYRMEFSEIMFASGVEPYTAEEQGYDQGSDLDDNVEDDDIVEGELVEDDAPPAHTDTPNRGRGADAAGGKGHARTADVHAEPGEAHGPDHHRAKPAAEPSPPERRSQRPAQPVDGNDRPLPLGAQLANLGKEAGVDYHHVIAALTGGASTSSKGLPASEARRAIAALNDIKNGELVLVETDGGWALHEPQESAGTDEDDLGRPFTE